MLTSLPHSALRMKPEKWIGLAGVALLLVSFLLQSDLLYQTSPLVLLVLAASGWLLSFKYEMPGSLLLLFAGAALWVQPLVFTGSKWLIPGGLLATIAGLMAVWKWWNSGDES